MAVFSKTSKLHDIKFGTDGWRALIAKEFTYKNLEIFLNGLAAYILSNYPAGKKLIIGHDARFLADRFAAFAAEKINSWGIDVLTINHPVPTPVIAFAAQMQEFNSCGAITFTASHNPPEYMGIKYIPEYAGPASLEITNKILAFIEEAAEDADKLKVKFTINNSANTQIINPRENYLTHIRSIVNLTAIKEANQKQITKLVYDPLFACGRTYTDSLLREAGFDLTVLHDHYDPTFGGSLPDPSEKRLTELKEMVIKSKAQLGAANDGDADRFAFLDEEGNFYPANKSLPIILKYLIEHKGYKGTVARTLATTHLLDEIAIKAGLKHIETAVGFKWLCEIMRREPTVLCAEESGGMSILGHIPEKDGILAILLLSEVMAITGKKLSTLWQEVQDYVGKKYFYDKLDLHLDGDLKDKFMATFLSPDLKQIGEFKVSKTDFTEGAKIYFDNGSWLLARPSGTEAMCRVYLEGNDKEALNKLVAAVQALIK
ncbi:MAG: hypothetical protein LW817_06880 [Candidatus Caenarcaniphilales bacterium]|jgi:phosphomannomutase|nr:hypothetical protein [Candidatus Caenarcaniphilales bacterium]